MWRRVVAFQFATETGSTEAASPRVRKLKEIKILLEKFHIFHASISTETFHLKFICISFYGG
jgi:hypothetical protein